MIVPRYHFYYSLYFLFAFITFYRFLYFLLYFIPFYTFLQESLPNYIYGKTDGPIPIGSFNPYVTIQKLALRLNQSVCVTLSLIYDIDLISLSIAEYEEIMS